MHWENLQMQYNRKKGNNLPKRRIMNQFGQHSQKYPWSRVDLVLGYHLLQQLCQVTAKNRETQ